jgi:hypothetical protein
VLLLLLAACTASDEKAVESRDPAEVDSPVDSEPGADPEPGFSELEELFSLPPSEYFGITTDRRPRDAQTLYAVPPAVGSNADDLWQPWFDVGNNSLLAEIDADGRVEYPVVYGPLAGYRQGGGATYGPKDFLAGSPWRFSVDLGDNPVPLDSLEDVAVELLGDQLFQWRYDLGDLEVAFVPFAPRAETPATVAPRALVALFRLENRGSTVLSGHLLAPEGLAQEVEAAVPATLYGPAPVVGANHNNSQNWVPRFSEVGYVNPGYEVVLPLGDSRWDTGNRVAFRLEEGESRVITLGLIVGGGPEELASTRDQLLAQKPLAWLNQSWGQPERLIGRLEIPDDPYVPALMARYAMIADDAFLVRWRGTAAP